MRCDCAQNLAAFQPVLADLLVVDDEFEKHTVNRGQGGQDAGRKAVGVDRDAQGRPGCGKAGQIACKGLLEKRDVVVVTDDAQAGFGRRAGLTPADQAGAEAVFQGFQALRDGRKGDGQVRRGPVKRALAVDGGEAGELGRAQH